MNLKDGDKVTLDGIEMEVSHSGPGGYWFKETGNGSYFTFVLKSKEDAENLFRAGRLKLGKMEKTESGKGHCSWHEWQKYVGLGEVYEFCKTCGAKKHKDWRLIKDERDY